MDFLRDTWRAILAGAVIFGLLAWGVHQLGEAREARGVAEAESARADSLEAAKARSDSIASDSIARLVDAREASEAREDSLAEEAAEAQERAVEAASRVDSVLVERADTVAVRLIDEERRAHEAEKAALRARIGELSTQLALADRTIEVLRERITASDELIERLRAEADAWEQAANPGFFGSIVGSVPEVLMGAGSVLLVLAVL